MKRSQRTECPYGRSWNPTSTDDEGEKARTFQLGEENNVNDVFDYAAIGEKTDTSKYQISEIDVTIGENTLKHKVDADNKEDKTTAEEISECFGDDFVIGEDADEENFIGEGKSITGRYSK